MKSFEFISLYFFEIRKIYKLSIKDRLAFFYKFIFNCYGTKLFKIYFFVGLNIKLNFVDLQSLN